MKNVAVILVGLLVVGCASIQTAYDYDMNANSQISVTFEGKEFLVQDNETESSALVMEGLATDAMKAFGEALTLGLADLSAPPSLYEGAMSVYLDTHKNTECEITRSNYITDGLGGGIGYEIFYECE